MRRVALTSVIALLLSVSLARADTTVYGKVQKFDSNTGEVTLITRKGNKLKYTITRDTPIYVYIEGKEIQKNWDFLKYNMGPGTKVKLNLSKGAVTKLVILEVPR